MRTYLSIWTALIGWEANKTGHLDKWLSLAGGLAGMLAVVWISKHYVDPQGTVGILASVGASAVLLFAVPHGTLSQPWPVVGGHVVSAFIGVACAKWISLPMVAAPVAVGFAIGAMYYLRCIHPPGGATALTAVVGGESLHALGFQYVVTPVLLNAIVIVAIAVLFNSLFAWRRYPAALSKARAKSDPHTPPPKAEEGRLTREDVEIGLSAMRCRADDNTGPDLRELYHLIESHKQTPTMASADIQDGCCYSNGLHGPLWQIRRVTGRRAKGSDTAQVAYRVVAGFDRRATGIADAGSFARWAKYEVFLNENSWQRVECAESPS